MDGWMDAWKELGEGEWPHSCHNETHPQVSFPFELPSRPNTLPPNTETSQQHNRIDRAIER